MGWPRLLKPLASLEVVGLPRFLKPLVSLEVMGWPRFLKPLASLERWVDQDFLSLSLRSRYTNRILIKKSVYCGHKFDLFRPHSRILNLFHHKWPWNYFVIITDVESFNLTYNLSTFVEKPNLTVFDFFLKFLTSSDLFWPWNYLFWKYNVESFIFMHNLLIFIKIEIWPILTFIPRFSTFGDLEWHWD